MGGRPDQLGVLPRVRRRLAVLDVGFFRQHDALEICGGWGVKLLLFQESPLPQGTDFFHDSGQLYARARILCVALFVHRDLQPRANVRSGNGCGGKIRVHGVLCSPLTDCCIGGS